MEKKDVDKEKDGENMPKLEFVEVVLVHCNIVKNNYQHISRVFFTFVPNKQFGQLIYISPHTLTWWTQSILNFLLLKFGLQPTSLKHLKLKIMLV